MYKSALAQRARDLGLYPAYFSSYICLVLQHSWHIVAQRAVHMSKHTEKQATLHPGQPAVALLDFLPWDLVLLSRAARSVFLTCPCDVTLKKCRHFKKTSTCFVSFLLESPLLLHI